jgi:phosphoribosylglycinamide formyltransferase-1
LIDEYRPQLVVLAGFMRILTETFVDHYAGHLMNIHPSLLPEFPGLDTHARAIAAGAARHGATVHFVVPEVDAGPLIIQAAVPVYDGDTPERLAERVLTEEHRILPLAIRWFAEGRLKIHDEHVLLDGEQRPEQGLQPAPSTPRREGAN